MSVIQKRVESALQPARESDIVLGGWEGGEGMGRLGGWGRQLFAWILQGHWDMRAGACAVGKG